ncbi:hypothetical protein [Streptomyces sp. NPDC048473]|uniref:hypothetical protein n=1 Tax=unclassified Streptomyces TaxID=2593676 RepID=UPI003714611B
MATKVTDPITKITGTTYDSLGRGTQVWLPSRLRILGAAPNYTYGYHPVPGDRALVSTSSLRPRASGLHHLLHHLRLPAAHP